MKIRQKIVAATPLGREIILEGDAAAMRLKIGAMGDLIDDTAPQLGGDLDTNGKDIIHSLLTASYPVFSDTNKKLISKKVEYADIKTKEIVALSNADATLTATQMVDDGIFTITPSSVARTLTTATAANIIAGIPNQQTGTWFDFTVICLSSFNVTIAAGANVTLIGDMVVNNDSMTLKALITSGTTVTILRM